MRETLLLHRINSCKKVFWKTTTHAYCVVVKKIYRKKVWHNIHDLNDNINSKYFFQKSYLVIKCSKKIFGNLSEYSRNVNLTSKPQKKQECKDFQCPAPCQIFWITNKTYTLSEACKFYEKYIWDAWVGLLCSGKLWRAISSKKYFTQHKIVSNKNWTQLAWQSRQ